MCKKARFARWSGSEMVNTEVAHRPNSHSHYEVIPFPRITSSVNAGFSRPLQWTWVPLGIIWMMTKKRSSGCWTAKLGPLARHTSHRAPYHATPPRLLRPKLLPSPLCHRCMLIHQCPKFSMYLYVPRMGMDQWHYSIPLDQCLILGDELFIVYSSLRHLWFPGTTLGHHLLIIYDHSTEEYAHRTWWAHAAPYQTKWLHHITITPWYHVSDYQSSLVWSLVGIPIIKCIVAEQSE
jgi:hypothetical protein